MKSETKKQTTVTITPSILNKAKEEGINISAFLEENLRADLKEREKQRWLEENKEAIDSMNAYYAKNEPSIKPLWMRKGE